MCQERELLCKCGVGFLPLLVGPALSLQQHHRGLHPPLQDPKVSAQSSEIPFLFLPLLFNLLISSELGTAFPLPLVGLGADKRKPSPTGQIVEEKVRD